MSQNELKCREEFEKWAKTQGYDIYEKSGQYLWDFTQNAFETWKAAYNRASTPAPEAKELLRDVNICLLYESFNDEEDYEKLYNTLKDCKAFIEQSGNYSKNSNSSTLPMQQGE